MLKSRAPLVLAVAVALGGCGLTPYGDAARNAVTDYGARVMDQALADAEFVICDGASVGSVRRRYGTSAERAKAWRELCRRDSEVEILMLPGS